jgi:Fe2+ or Zn2+ uptake regulation protein
LVLVSRWALLCESCGGATELAEEEAESVRQAVAQVFDFEVIEHRILMHGRCAACRLHPGGPPPKERA